MGIFKKELEEIKKVFLKGLRYYNTDYGDLHVYRTEDSIIIKLYNGGFSENEEIERELKKVYSPLLDDHPITIFRFRRWLLLDEVPKFYNYLLKKSTHLEKFEYYLTIG